MSEFLSLVQIQEEIENIYNLVSIDPMIKTTGIFVTDSKTFTILELDPTFSDLEIKNVGITSYKKAIWRDYTIYTFPNCPKGIYYSMGFYVEGKVL